MFILIARRVLWGMRGLNAAVVSRWVLHRGSKPMVLTLGSTLVFAAHQDDETLGCGGLIALKRAAGVPVVIVFLTDGGAVDPRVTRRISDRADYKNVRIAEALAATHLLGVLRNHVVFLGLPDGMLGRVEGSARQALIDRLAKIIMLYHPQEIFVHHRHDRHPDHEAAFHLVREALTNTCLRVRLFQYCVWLPWLSFLAPEITTCHRISSYQLSIRGVCRQKRLALAKYASQTSTFPHGFLRGFLLPFELFFEAELTGSSRRQCPCVGFVSAG